MNGRILASIIAAVSVVALTSALFVVKAPYAIFGPGPVCNAVGHGTRYCTPVDATSLITISPPSADHPSTSQLGFTTVSVESEEQPIAAVLADWLDSSKAVVPREVVVPPGENQKTVDRQNRDEMRNAQDNAIVATEALLGLNAVKIAGVQSGFPAAGALRVGDVVRTVNGKPIRSGQELINIITAVTDPKATFTFAISRSGSPMTVTVGRRADPQEGGRLLLGVTLTDVGTGPTANITLDPAQIGGPSAGLMFALGVYDRLTPGNLAGNTVVAGTGTIDGAGAVGPIGGIQQKMYAARHDFKARVFLAPQGDCVDTKGAIPKGLQVVAVKTLSGALSALAAVRAGNTAGLPRC